jgi:hypothetical protein
MIGVAVAHVDDHHLVLQNFCLEFALWHDLILAPGKSKKLPAISLVTLTGLKAN